jgi:hypothetical protein
MSIIVAMTISMAMPKFSTIATSANESQRFEKHRRRKLKHRAVALSSFENKQRVENVRQGDTDEKGDPIRDPIVHISREDEEQCVGHGVLTAPTRKPVNSQAISFMA